MLEPDASRGGLTRAAIEALLKTARFPPHDRAHEPANQTWAAKWALDGEVQAWGYAAIPTCEQIVAALFALPSIEWNRFTAFLQVTMRLTAERLLSEADRGDALYVQGEVGNQTLMPPALTQRRTHHLYCSPHNIGADRLGAELNELFRRRSGKDRRGRRSVADAAPLKVTTSFAELEQCEHMLVYLTSATWTTAEGSVQYAREVAHAQRLGVHLLLVHEFPSAMDEPGNPRGACDFNDFWNEGWTPKHLLTGEANVYKQIAIALKPGAWRAAGLATVALKMGEGGGERQPIELMEEVEQAGLAAHVPAQQLQQKQKQRQLPPQQKPGQLPRRRMSLQNLVGVWAQRSTRANEHLSPASDATGGALTLNAPSAPPNALAKSSKLQCSMRRLSISSGLLSQRPARGSTTVRGGINQGGVTARSGGGITRRGLGGVKTQASDRHRERRSHLDDDNDEEEGGADVVNAPLESGTALQRLQAQRANRGGHHGTSEPPPSFRAAPRRKSANLPNARALPPP